MTIIKAPSAMLEPGAPLAENSAWLDRLDSGIEIITQMQPDKTLLTTYTGIPQNFNITLEHVQGIVACAGEVLDWWCWFIIPESELSNPVPAFFDGATDWKGDAVLWKDWHDATHTIDVLNGFARVASDSLGVRMAGSIIAQITAQTCPNVQVLNYNQCIQWNIDNGVNL